MLAKVHSMGLFGIDAFPVEVEVYVTRSNLPRATIVGLPDASVKESIDRGKATAFGAWGFRSDRLAWHTSERKNTEEFLKLLRDISRRRPSGWPAKLVMDNALYGRLEKVEPDPPSAG